MFQYLMLANALHNATSIQLILVSVCSLHPGLGSRCLDSVCALCLKKKDRWSYTAGCSCLLPCNRRREDFSARSETRRAEFVSR